MKVLARHYSLACAARVAPRSHTRVWFSYSLGRARERCSASLALARMKTGTEGILSLPVPSCEHLRGAGAKAQSPSRVRV